MCLSTPDKYEIQKNLLKVGEETHSRTAKNSLLAEDSEAAP